MTMADQPTETPKPKRKPQRRKPRAATAATPKVPAEFEGLSPTDCCDACNEKGCVITGLNVCGHPMKGGLQSAQMRQPDVVKRYNRARRALADAKLDLQKLAGG